MGLKPRTGAPIVLSMNAGGGGFSRSASIDLRTGRCSATVSSKDWNIKDSDWVTRSVKLVIPRGDLPALRTTARKILAAGNTMYREQFAQQGVSFTARSRGNAATADFAIDVGVGTVYDDAWDLVFRRVERTLEAR